MHKYVALKILIPLVVSIVLYEFLDLPHSLIILGLLLFTSIGFSLFSRSLNYIKWARSTSVWLSTTIAFVLFSFQYNLYQESSSKVNLSGKRRFIAIATELPKVGKYANFPAKIIAADSANAAGALVQIVLDTARIQKAIKPGDTIAATGYFNQLQSTTNPHAFDYARFLAFRGIYYQVRVYQLNTHTTAHNLPWHKIIKWRWRYQIGEQLKQMVAPAHWGIAQALLLGERAHLDNETKEDFKNVGAIHVLAVSGLHIGIVISVFLLLLNKIPKHKRVLRILLSLISIMALIVFSELTGGNPPVRRSGLMIGFLLFGQMNHHKTYSLNLLFLSAILLLIINPTSLFDVSFQLSFTAVLGIVSCYPVIYKSLLVKNYFLNKIWQLIAVSISAQVFTFPITIYYFHQFPLLFAFSSIIAIMAATAIIYLGMLALLFGFIYAPSTQLIGHLLNNIFSLLKSSMSFMAGYKQFTLGDLWIEPVEVVILLMAMLSIVLFIYHRKKTLLPLAFGLIIIQLSYHNYQVSIAKSQFEIIQYDARLPAIDIIKGHTVYSWYHPDLNSKELHYVSANYRMARYIKNKITIPYSLATKNN